MKHPIGVKYEAKIIRITDGDTIVFEADWLPDPLKKELSLRVFGVDTPEKGHRASCPQEALLSKKAHEFTTKFISQGRKKEITIIDWDKYGGRVLGDVIIDGKSLRKILLETNLAYEYFGDTKRSWCD